MKLITVIGARPQFIKAAAVSRAIATHNQSPGVSPITELIIHTGQHYDHNMSRVFFQELNIPEPNLNLDVGSGAHGEQTGQMLAKLEKVFIEERPDYVLVYGDTNSTLAGALAASKLHLPVAHVEAGLRSFNRRMPEEINRVIADHLSTILFCPTQTAVDNLKNEGISHNPLPITHNPSPLTPHLDRVVTLPGDVMYDSVLYNSGLAENRSHILEGLDLKPKKYALATIHRAENTDDPERLKAVFAALNSIGQNGLRVILPLHPRTRKILNTKPFQLTPDASLSLIDPVSYLDMLMLEKNARIILTDSGGVQKEAYWFEVPCITLRDETEWVETVESGWNTITGTNQEKIIAAANSLQAPAAHPNLFGDGTAAQKIIETLTSGDG